MSNKRPAKNRTVTPIKPPTPEELVTEMPDTPVPEWKPAPVDVPAPTPTAPDAKIPLGLASSIASILQSLPPETRKEANETLLSGLQDHISQVKAAVEAESAREIVMIRETLVAEARKTIDEKISELSKAAAPTSAADMAKLVSQEYLRFPLKIVVMRDGPGNEEPTEVEMHFTIREMPQATERLLAEALTLKVIPLISKFQGIKFTAGSSNLDKLEQAIRTAPEILDIVAETTALCLNPYGKRPDITSKWVQENIATSRQMAIIEAQFMASRIRDFFYAVSRVIPRT